MASGTRRIQKCNGYKTNAKIRDKKKLKTTPLPIEEPNVKTYRRFSERRGLERALLSNLKCKNQLSKNLKKLKNINFSHFNLLKTSDPVFL